MEKDYDYFFGEAAQLRNDKRIRDFAMYKSQRVALDSYKKSKLAELMVEAQRQNIKAIGNQESFAYSHPDYIAIINGLQIATRKETELQYQLKMFEIEVEVWRTEQANNRKLM